MATKMLLAVVVALSSLTACRAEPKESPPAHAAAADSAAPRAPVARPDTSGRASASDDSLRLGLLIVPFEDRERHMHGTAGDTVQFRDTPGNGAGYDIVFDGTTYRDVWSARVIPFDSTFAPSYVYQALTSAGTMYRDDPTQDARDRAALATRATQLFAYHPYRDHFAVLACRGVYRLEGFETDGKTSWPKSRGCVADYLRTFPAGAYRDEMEWLGVQLEHASYEYEGDPSPAIAEERAFSSYLQRHPRHAQRTEIEFTIARLCYVIQEMMTEEPPDSAAANMMATRDAYRAQADSIYSQLARSSDPAVASRAAVQLFNLRAGRRIYVGPNPWE